MLNDSPPPSLHPLKPFPSWEDSTSACPVPLWGAQLTNDLSQGSPLIHSSLVQQAIINCSKQPVPNLRNREPHGSRKADPPNVLEDKQFKSRLEIIHRYLSTPADHASSHPAV